MHANAQTGILPVHFRDTGVFIHLEDRKTIYLTEGQMSDS